MGDGWRYCSGWWHLSCEKDSEGHDFENCKRHGSGSKRLRLTPPMILPTFSPPKALQSQTLSLHPCPTLTSTKTVLNWKNRPKDPPPHFCLQPKDIANPQFHDQCLLPIAWIHTGHGLRNQIHGVWWQNLSSGGLDRQRDKLGNGCFEDKVGHGHAQTSSGSVWCFGAPRQNMMKCTLLFWVLLSNT